MKNNKGFTLTELLATVAILGIILGIATVSYQGVSLSIKHTQYNNLLVKLESYVKEFAYDNGFVGVMYVNVEELINDGYVSADSYDGKLAILSPKNSAESVNCVQYKVESSDSDYMVSVESDDLLPIGEECPEFSRSGNDIEILCNGNTCINGAYYNGDVLLTVDFAPGKDGVIDSNSTVIWSTSGKEDVKADSVTVEEPLTSQSIIYTVKVQNDDGTYTTSTNLNFDVTAPKIVTNKVVGDKLVVNAFDETDLEYALVQGDSCDDADYQSNSEFDLTKYSYPNGSYAGNDYIICIKDSSGNVTSSPISLAKIDYYEFSLNELGKEYKTVIYDSSISKNLESVPSYESYFPYGWQKSSDGINSGPFQEYDKNLVSSSDLKYPDEDLELIPIYTRDDKTPAYVTGGNLSGGSGDELWFNATDDSGVKGYITAGDGVTCNEAAGFEDGDTSGIGNLKTDGLSGGENDEEKVTIPLSTDMSGSDYSKLCIYDNNGNLTEIELNIYKLTLNPTDSSGKLTNSSGGNVTVGELTGELNSNREEIVFFVDSTQFYQLGTPEPDENFYYKFSAWYNDIYNVSFSSMTEVYASEKNSKTAIDSNRNIYLNPKYDYIDVTPPTVDVTTTIGTSSATISIKMTDSLGTDSGLYGYEVIPLSSSCSDTSLTSFSSSKATSLATRVTTKTVSVSKATGDYRICVYDNTGGLTQKTISIIAVTYINNANIRTASTTYYYEKGNTDHSLINQTSVTGFSSDGWYSSAYKNSITGYYEGGSLVSNVSSLTSSTTLYARYTDTSYPVITLSSINQTSGTITLSTSDVGSGVYGWYYLGTSSSSSCSNYNTSSSFSMYSNSSSVKSHTVLTGGTHYFCVRDNFGNVTKNSFNVTMVSYTNSSYTSNNAVHYWKTGSGTIQTLTSKSYYTASWYNSSTGSTVSSVSSLATGTYSLSAKYTDNTNPTITLSGISTSGTISGTMSDTGSGVYGYYYLGTSSGTCPTSTSSYTKSTSISKSVSSGGTHYFCAIDNEGNRSTVASYSTIKVTYSNNGNTGSTGSTYYYVKGTSVSMVSQTSVSNYTSKGWYISGLKITSLSSLSAGTYTLTATYTKTTTSSGSDSSSDDSSSGDSNSGGSNTDSDSTTETYDCPNGVLSILGIGIVAGVYCHDLDSKVLGIYVNSLSDDCTGIVDVDYDRNYNKNYLCCPTGYESTSKFIFGTTSYENMSDGYRIYSSCAKYVVLKN